MTLRLLVAYDGTRFAGYQGQPGQRTVQGALEDALGTIVSEPVPVTAAGRTDAGVHARGQVVSVDHSALDPAVVLRAMPALLPHDVGVLDAQPAPDGFEARRDARSRSYVYLLWRDPTPDPAYAPYSLWIREPVDVDLLDRELASLVGTHDVTSFGRIRDDQRRERTISAAGAEADGPFIRISITGRSFVHQMVRSVVGTALEAATGRRAAGFTSRALEARDRSAAGQVAPPHGLALVHVGYDDAPWPSSTGPVWPWAAQGDTEIRLAGGWS